MDVEEYQLPTAIPVKAFAGSQKSWVGSVEGTLISCNATILFRNVAERAKHEDIPLITTDGFEFYERVIGQVFGQKAMTQMNLQLHHVISDITGLTGMRIIRAIAAGEREMLCKLNSEPARSTRAAYADIPGLAMAAAVTSLRSSGTGTQCPEMNFLSAYDWSTDSANGQLLLKPLPDRTGSGR